ncbi:PAS domain-containing protein [Bacillus salacetis]|uniref:histidine kinase n=1 Tax=Bacillus salacetis TaxID=2315464 RepID=A0A3A1QPP0_9BACI|nr:ATP-binding protein [Bacillus salacetis]RIW29039.1 PAS domain-containing protein [Bacillus salacetis]
MIKDFDFSHLIDNSLDAKAILRSGIILYANQRFTDLLGFPQGEVIIGCDIFHYTHPDYHEIGLVRRTCVVNGDVVPFIEQKLIGFDGRMIDVEVMAAPLLHSSGEIFVHAIFRDLSGIKKKEELLRQSEKLSLIGELASGIVHEIRNPLTAMKGFLQLMKSYPNPEYVDIVLKELNQIEEIANELLQFSKPGERRLTRQNILEIVREAVNFSGAESFKRKIKVELHDHPQREIEILGNKTQLKQVLLNIIKNSIDAIKNDGKINIHISKDQQNVYIHISDNGVGIPKEQLSKIGQSFFTSKEKGTGLGLMVSFNIIKNHNGSIHIDSEENHGTTFKISLPLANKEALPLSY